jgi:hypothetical protein
LAFWWQLIMGGLFIFVVLVMRDGIVGTIAKWLRRRPRPEMGDEQKDWRPGEMPLSARLKEGFAFRKGAVRTAAGDRMDQRGV